MLPKTIENLLDKEDPVVKSSHRLIEKRDELNKYFPTTHNVVGWMVGLNFIYLIIGLAIIIWGSSTDPAGQFQNNTYGVRLLAWWLTPYIAFTKLIINPILSFGYQIYTFIYEMVYHMLLTVFMYREWGINAFISFKSFGWGLFHWVNNYLSCFPEQYELIL